MCQQRMCFQSDTLLSAAESFTSGGKHPMKMTDGVLRIVELAKLQNK